MEHFYVTTPIYYVNDVPHLGHAYTTVVADTFARYHRRLGVPTFFATGTDEHGQKIERAAAAQGVTPKELADRVVVRFQELWQRLGIAYDDFIRTTEPRHERLVQEVWRRMAAKGDIYLGTYEGWYCVGCEAYYTEKELREGHCPVCDREAEHRSEPSYFFRLSRYQQPLLEHLDTHPEFVRPASRHNEVRAFVAAGLADLSVSRTSIRWGIPVPDDPDHVIYVWVDALFNYLSVLEPGNPGKGRYPDLWPPTLQLIGKDILRFHAVYWPAFLMSAGYPLPRTIFAHGWWTVEGRKMSKSLRNVVDPVFLVEEYGRDPIRYFLLREVPLGQDGDFSHANLIGRINADLANDLGNLVSRTLGMVRRFGGGRLGAARILDPADGELAAAFPVTFAAVEEAMAEIQPHRALEAIWALVGRLNRYIDHRQPWALAKAGRDEEMGAVLRWAAEGIVRVGALLEPFMPDTGARILDTFGIADGTWHLEEFDDRRAGFAPRIPEEATPGELGRLFARIDKEEAEHRLERIAALAKSDVAPVSESGTAEERPTPDAIARTLDYETFAQVDLRVGRILAAEKIPKAKKLLKLIVDLGEPEPRTIVAGIAKSYEPEELADRHVLVVANLAPAKLMGIESQGMILAGGEGPDRLRLIEPPADLPPGTRVK